MAVVNEDPVMVKHFLDNGANVHSRCIGKFFCPDDQKDARMNCLNHEHYILPVETNYEG